jgi:hypothetical protein
MLKKKILTVASLAFAGTSLFFAAFLAASQLQVQDLAQYWAAAHLFAQNPYSMEPTRAFERSAGILSTPLVTKTPPWAIVLLLPLGLLNYPVSFALWSVASVFIVVGCAKTIWDHCTSEASLAPVFLSLFFGPTVVLLMLGQFTVFVLLGAVLFCVFAGKRRDWLAGASLLLVVGKPHIALLFLFAVLLWALYFRRWIVLLSAGSAWIAACTAALLINPHVFEQFWRRTLLVVGETESYPNLGGMLYSISGLHILALLPQLAGLIWLVFYWRKHRAHWDWEDHGLVVLLCSVACSYYSYPYDEILAIPALMISFAKGNRLRFLVVFVLTDLGFGFYISNFAGRFGFGYMFLWWTALGWLLAYIVARQKEGVPLAFNARH